MLLYAQASTGTSFTHIISFNLTNSLQILSDYYSLLLKEEEEGPQMSLTWSRTQRWRMTELVLPDINSHVLNHFAVSSGRKKTAVPCFCPFCGIETIFAFGVVAALDSWQHGYKM